MAAAIESSADYDSRSCHMARKYSDGRVLDDHIDGGGMLSKRRSWKFRQSKKVTGRFTAGGHHPNSIPNISLWKNPFQLSTLNTQALIRPSEMCILIWRLSSNETRGIGPENDHTEKTLIRMSWGLEWRSALRCQEGKRKAISHSNFKAL